MKNNYQPFGTEWEKEMMKFTKKQLVQTLKQHLSLKKQGVVECWYCHKKYGTGHNCSTCGREGR